MDGQMEGWMDDISDFSVNKLNFSVFIKLNNAGKMTTSCNFIQKFENSNIKNT